MNFSYFGWVAGFEKVIFHKKAKIKNIHTIHDILFIVISKCEFPLPGQRPGRPLRKQSFFEALRHALKIIHED